MLATPLVTPTVPTPLSEVRVRERGDPGLADVVLVGRSPADEPPVLGPGADRLGVDGQWLDRYRVSAAAGSVHVVPLVPAEPDRGWLVGTGQGSTQDWRSAGAGLVRAVAAQPAGGRAAQRGARPPSRVQVHLPPDTSADQAAALALGCVAGSHRYRVTGEDAPATPDVVLIAPPGCAPGPLAGAVARAQVLGWATGLARDLANT
ncbi:MAG: hypothetical protein ACRDSH_22320, partial [Pseudonocardiaceae bacterium]